MSVIQFSSPPGAVTQIGLTLLDTSASPSPAQLCSSVRNLARINATGGTPLAEAANAARAVFQASTTGATERLVVLLSDLDGFNTTELAAAEVLRTMGVQGEAGAAYSGPPARIVALRFYAENDSHSCAFGFNGASPNPFEVLTNVPGFCPPIHDPSQTMGDFVCRSLCWGQPPTTGDIHAFIDLVLGGLCSV